MKRATYRLVEEARRDFIGGLFEAVARTLVLRECKCSRPGLAGELEGERFLARLQSSFQ
jgi:hypothetical protein